MTSNGVI